MTREESFTYDEWIKDFPWTMQSNGISVLDSACIFWPGWTLSIYNWCKVIEQILYDYDITPDKFYLLEMKEKYNACQMAWQVEGISDEGFKALLNATNLLELETRATCSKCGKLKNNESMYTLCGKCANRGR